MSGEVRQETIDPSGSFLVQAPAGSGKTELLTRRILALLAVVDEPEEILALTFTRKAAAEMRGRVIEALAMPKPDDATSHRMETWQLAQAANCRSEERGWHLEVHPSRLRVMTLDSLTHALARQMPLLSGFGEMPRSSTHVAPLYREAAERAMARLEQRSHEKAEAVLLHQDHNMVALIELVADMLGKRDQWLHELHPHVNDPDALRRMQESVLAEVMQQKLQLSAALLPVDVQAKLPALLRFAGANLDDDMLIGVNEWPDAAIDQLAVWQRIANLLLTSGKAAFRKRVDKGVGFPADKAFAEQKRQFQEMLAVLAETGGLAEALHDLRLLPPEPRLDDGQWRVLEAQLDLLLEADAHLQRLFVQRGEADFIEIAMRAMRALEDEQGRPTDLLLRLDYRIHHILVDEFQDTSLLQLRLLLNLTEGWQAGDGTHRTLFMVGDPMQSIYRFRKAEVGLFLLAAANQARLPDVEARRLQRNFRSSPQIVDWVNRTFSRIFPAKSDTLRAAVEHAAAEAALDHAGEVHLHLQPDKDAAAEAVAVVETIRHALQTDGARIAVLSRSRRHLHAIMQTLTDARIAFRAVDILPLNAQPEIRLLRALVRALLHPADRVSWAALLRAPCCGLPTDAMHQLLADDLRPVAAILADNAKLAALDEEARRRVVFLRQVLESCLPISGRIPVRDLLQMVWESLGMRGLLDADARRNVEAMYDLVEEIEDGGLIDFALLDERLEKLYAAADSSPEAARVELLTMHAAKGLQWDVVILPGLGYGNSKSDSPLLAMTEVMLESGVQPLIAVRPPVRGKDAVYDLVRSLEKVRENNELARLLYVACTRAETSLQMFGHVAEKSGEPANGSLLKLLLPDGVDGGCFDATLHFLETQDSTSAQERRALTRIRSLSSPVLPPESLEESESEYFWAGPEAAPVGNAMHAALQHVGEHGIEAWTEVNTATEIDRMRRMLLAEGLSGAALDRALQRLETAFRQVLQSERARWILSGQHAEARCEWALSSRQGSAVQHHVLDRSFLDADGMRWIVDYKTASHEGSESEAFLAEEMKRHAPQLARYVATLRALEPQRKIRAALYFPMLDRWCEWEPVE